MDAWAGSYGGVVSSEDVERAKATFQSWNLADPPAFDTLVAPGVPDAALLSLHHQEAVVRVRRHHGRGVPGSLMSRKNELLERYLVHKESVRCLAKEVDCPPCELLRCVVDFVLEKELENTELPMKRVLQASGLGHGKKAVSRTMREPTLLLNMLSHMESAVATAAAAAPAAEDAEEEEAGGEKTEEPANEDAMIASSVTDAEITLRLRSGALAHVTLKDIIPGLVEDIVQYTRSDAVHSALLDETRREIGDEYEENLAYCLRSADIPFAREDELRRQGQAKTPDFQLIVPIIVSGKCIHWIESKALFADTKTFREHLHKQLNKYKNRFGPGLVIYWFGYEACIAHEDDDILVLDAFPTADVIVRLAKEPIASKVVHGPLGCCVLTDDDSREGRSSSESKRSGET